MGNQIVNIRTNKGIIAKGNQPNLTQMYLVTESNLTCPGGDRKNLLGPYNEDIMEIIYFLLKRY